MAAYLGTITKARIDSHTCLEATHEDISLTNFHKKMVGKVLADLQAFKELKISSFILEKNVRLNMGALDSTVPPHVINTLESILWRIEDYRQEQYVAMLNTDAEGCFDPLLPTGTLFDCDIAVLQDYCTDYSCE